MKVRVDKFRASIDNPEWEVYFSGISDRGVHTTQKAVIKLNSNRAFYPVEEIVAILEKTIRELKEMREE